MLHWLVGGTGNLYIYFHYRILNSHGFSAWSTVFTGGIKLDRFADYTLLSDGKTLTLYVDKSWVNSKPLPRNIGIYYTSNDVYIGKRPASGNVFRGHLCRVNIKNYPISKCWRPGRPAIAVVMSSVWFIQYAILLIWSCLAFTVEQYLSVPGRKRLLAQANLRGVCHESGRQHLKMYCHSVTQRGGQCAQFNGRSYSMIANSRGQLRLLNGGFSVQWEMRPSTTAYFPIVEWSKSPGQWGLHIWHYGGRRGLYVAFHYL